MYVILNILYSILSIFKPLPKNIYEQEGKDSYKKGYPEVANPYKEGTQENELWNKGYNKCLKK